MAELKLKMSKSYQILSDTIFIFRLQGVLFNIDFTFPIYGPLSKKVSFRPFKWWSVLLKINMSRLQMILCTEVKKINVLEGLYCILRWFHLCKLAMCLAINITICFAMCMLLLLLLLMHNSWDVICIDETIWTCRTCHLEDME